MVWGESSNPCLGSALCKQASLCPDGHCLTTVCCGTSQAWAAPLPRPQDSLGRGSRSSHTSGRAGAGTGRKVIQTGMRKGGACGETQREQLALPGAEPRGAGGRPWYTQQVASQVGPDLQAGPPGSSLGPGSGPDLHRDQSRLLPLGLSFPPL